MRSLESMVQVELKRYMSEITIGNKTFKGFSLEVAVKKVKSVYRGQRDLIVDKVVADLCKHQ